jgi:hypothetical protein
MPTDWFRHYLVNRLFEWVMTLALLGNGLLLFRWPDALEAGLFRYVWLVFSPSTLTSMYIGFAICRGIALIMNGGWPIWGPRWRMLGAFGGTLVWTQMTLSLITSAWDVGAPSLSIPTYGALAIGELYSMYRAARDHGHR